MKGLNLVHSPNAAENSTDYRFNGLKLNRFLSLSKREIALLIQRHNVNVSELDWAAFALQADPAGRQARIGSFVLEHAIDITTDSALVAMDFI